MPRRRDLGVAWALGWVVLWGLAASSGLPTTAEEPAAAETPSVDPPAGDDVDAAPSDELAADNAGEPEAGEEPVAIEEPSPADAPVAEPARPDVRRIRLKLDASGEIFAPAGRDVPPVRRPITVDARFDFVQVAGEGVQDTERRYLDATADVRVDGSSQQTRLPSDVRTIRVALRGATPTPYLDAGFPTREELDLLETPFDPLLVDRILPPTAVAIGDSWPVSPDIVAGLLAIDTVESGGVDARLDDVSDGRAVVRLTGIVDGAADGVPTHVTVEGTCGLTTARDEERYRLGGGETSLAITLTERREASHVAPGFDIEARVTLASAPLETAPAAAGAGAASRPGGEGRPGLVWYRDSAGRYDLVHDARWRVIEDGSDGLVMRLLDHGALVAQCSIASLPPAPAQKPPSIAEVERDLERSLAGQFGRLEHSSEATRSDGVRFVRVAAGGRADGLPFRWIHHVLTDAAGHRLAVTCMLEESQATRFGTADRALIDGVSFPAAAVAGGETGGDRPADGDRQARLPMESRTP